MLDLVDTPRAVVDSVDMPTETAFNKLKERVEQLERHRGPVSWVQKHPTMAWILGISVTIIAVLVSIFLGLLPHLEQDSNLRIKNQVNDSLREPLTKIDRMAQDISEIKGELTVLLPAIKDQAKKKIKESPNLSKDQFEAQLPELNAALRVAASERITLDVATVRQVRDKLFQTTANTPSRSRGAWDTFVALISYQSFLNAQIDPKYRSYTHRAPPLEPQAGIPSKITRHYSNNVFVNLTVQLDGASWDGDIFKDSIIQYNGGPVALRNVRFVNCRFEIPTSIPAQELGKEILASNTVSFSHIS